MTKHTKWAVLLMFVFAWILGVILNERLVNALIEEVWHDGILTKS